MSDSDKTVKKKWTMSDSLRYFIDENNKRCKGIRKIINYPDAIICYVVYGASFHNYMKMKFYEKGFFEKGKFLTTNRLYKELNKIDKESWEAVDDKVLFNKNFSKYLKREWLDLTECTYDDFCAFIKKYNTFFLKPKREHSGVGVSKCISGCIVDTRSFYDNNRNMIVEEEIVQHHEMVALNPSAVNTIRVVTINNNGKVGIFAAVLRCGRKGNFVDNSNSDGIFSQIDVGSGVCCTHAVNYISDVDDKFTEHPDTGVVFKGFRIPNWETIVETVKEAAGIVPGCKIIGWDAVALEDGCALIEGNPNTAAEVIQTADNIGKYKLFREMVKEG